MNNQPITRRDVFALVIYLALAYNVLEGVLILVGQVGLAQLPAFNTAYATTRGSWLQLAINFVCALALLPFVQLAATSAAGKRAQHPVSKSALLSLLLPCVGFLLFVTVIPQAISFAYEYWQAKSFASSSSRASLLLGYLLPFHLQNIVSALIRLSLGFALAFFPAIFDSLRHPADERNAA